MEPIRVIIIGAGNRGSRYAMHMAEMKEKYQIVAVADPVETRREYVRQLYDLPQSACYDSWEAVLAQPKFADVAVISVMDNMHYIPALQAMEKGYHLLLEKPVAQTAQECSNECNGNIDGDCNLQ